MTELDGSMRGRAREQRRSARALMRTAGGLLVAGVVAGFLGGLGSTSLLAQVPLTEHTLRLEEGSPSPAARIGDFSFLEGRWEGTGLGGDVDELWSRPMGSTMVGAFRLVQEGRVTFYEIYALEEEDETVVFRLKHFDPGPGLPGWEERDEETVFRLIRVEPEVAWFNGLTLRRTGPDELVIHLALRSADQDVREEVFRLRRAGR